MKKIGIMICGLLFFAIPLQTDAKCIYFKHRIVDRGKARTVLPYVCGELESKVLALSVNRYIGDVYVCIYDAYGNVILTDSKSIQDRSTLSLNLCDFAEGEYWVMVALGDNVYNGIFFLN